MHVDVSQYVSQLRVGMSHPPPATRIYIDNYTDHSLILLTTISCHSCHLCHWGEGLVNFYTFG